MIGASWLQKYVKCDWTFSAVALVRLTLSSSISCVCFMVVLFPTGILWKPASTKTWMLFFPDQEVATSQPVPMSVVEAKDTIIKNPNTRVLYRMACPKWTWYVAFIVAKAWSCELTFTETDNVSKKHVLHWQMCGPPAFQLQVKTVGSHNSTVQFALVRTFGCT